MILSDEMRRLTQDFQEAYGARSAAVADIRTDTAEELAEFHVAHQAMAAEDARGRLEDVDTLRSDTAAMLGDLRAELDEARRVWSDFTTLMQQRRAGKPVARSRPPVKEYPPAEEVAAGDLTVIRGIGPRMQQRLNQAGIFTYAQLAASSAEELGEAIGAMERLANVEDWIDQARDLVRTD